MIMCCYGECRYTHVMAPSQRHWVTRSTKSSSTTKQRMTKCRQNGIGPKVMELLYFQPRMKKGCCIEENLKFKKQLSFLSFFHLFQTRFFLI